METTEREPIPLAGNRWSGGNGVYYLTDLAAQAIFDLPPDVVGIEEEAPGYLVRTQRLSTVGDWFVPLDDSSEENTYYLQVGLPWLVLLQEESDGSSFFYLLSLIEATYTWTVA